MKHFIILVFIINLINNAKAQKETGIELNVGTRYDLQAKYNTTYNSMAPKEMKLWGASNTIGINIKRTLTKKLSVYFGTGFYELNINRIRYKGGIGNFVKKARLINYTPPDFSKPQFSTNKYHYYNISGTAGATYQFKENEKRKFYVGADIITLYNFAQKYSLSSSSWNSYNTKRNRFLGYNVNSFIGYTQKIGNKKRYYISPKLLLPVYQSIIQDVVFNENELHKMTKWFNGIGVSIAFGKIMQQKKPSK